MRIRDLGLNLPPGGILSFGFLLSEHLYTCETHLQNLVSTRPNPIGIKMSCNWPIHKAMPVTGQGDINPGKMHNT